MCVNKFSYKLNMQVYFTVLASPKMCTKLILILQLIEDVQGQTTNVFRMV